MLEEEEQLCICIHVTEEEKDLIDAMRLKESYRKGRVILKGEFYRELLTRGILDEEAELK